MSGGGGVNASIPLAFNPVQAGPNIGQAIQDAGAFQAFQEQGRRIQGQNAIRAIFQDPASLDPAGLPTQNALNKIMAADPATGLAMQNNMAKLQRSRFDASLAKLNISDALEGMMRSTASDASMAYDEAIKAKKSPEEAQRLAQDVYSQGFDRIKTSGVASPEQLAALPQSFDPIKTPRGAEYFKQRTAERKAAQEDRSLNLAERKIESTDRHTQALEGLAAGRLDVSRSGEERRLSELRERERHNTAVETIQTNRGLTDKEKADRMAEERERHNRATEDVSSGRLDVSRTAEDRRSAELKERERHNTVTEDIQTSRVLSDAEKAERLATERERHNRELEGLGATREQETARHNVATEAQPRTGAAAERDATIIAADRIEAEDKRRQAAGEPAMTDAEKASFRQQARIDPKIAQHTQQLEAGGVTDAAAKLAAEQALAGDWSGVTGLGRDIASRRKVTEQLAVLAKEKGMSGSDLAAMKANFAGATAASRILGTRMVGIDLGIAEAQRFAPMVKEISDKIDRTRYPSLNSMQLAIDKGTGGEDVVRLVDALNAFKMAYTQILTRGGMPTDDSRRRSDEIIDKAWSTGQINAAIDQLGKEMSAAREASTEVRGNLYRTVSGKAPPKELGQVQPDPKPAAAGAADGPPANLLREGVETTFKNGQTWTLKGGQPQRVK